MLKLRRTRLETLDEGARHVRAGLATSGSDTPTWCASVLRTSATAVLDRQKTATSVCAHQHAEHRQPYHLCHLEKYGYHAPYTATSTTTTRILHELCTTSARTFMDEVHIDKKINGIITRETKRDTSLISHSARDRLPPSTHCGTLPRNKILEHGPFEREGISQIYLLRRRKLTSTTRGLRPSFFAHKPSKPQTYFWAVDKRQKYGISIRI